MGKVLPTLKALSEQKDAGHYSVGSLKGTLENKWYYKSSEQFYHSNGICYVPTNGSKQYTAQDFVDLCRGNTVLAEDLFNNSEGLDPALLLQYWETHHEISTCPFLDCMIFDPCTFEFFCPFLEKNVGYKLALTLEGKETFAHWLELAKVKRVEAIKAGEICNATELPSEADIESDLNNWPTTNCDYSSNWNITEKSVLTLSLKCGKDFKPVKIEE